MAPQAFVRTTQDLKQIQDMADTKIFFLDKIRHKRAKFMFRTGQQHE